MLRERFFEHSRKLVKNGVRAEIDRSQRARSERTEFTQDFILKSLKQIFERLMQIERVLDKHGKPTGEFCYEGEVADRAFQLMGDHTVLASIFQDSR